MNRNLWRNVAPLLLVAASAMAGRLQAAPIYRYSFDGMYTGSSFVARPAVLNPVQIGDLFRLSFEVDAASGTVQNIVASFPTRGILLAPAGTAGWWANAGASLYHYRWDISFPDAPEYTMVFWFRTSTPGVVIPGVPAELNTSDFNITHHWGVYWGTPQTGGPSAMSLEVNTAAPTPEPGTFLLLVVGVGLIAVGRVVGWGQGQSGV